MKKLSKILCLSMVASFTLSAVACGGGGSTDKNNSSSVKLDADGRRVVVFEYLDAGFGDAPYEAVAKAYMDRNKDVKIELLPNRELAGTLGLALSTKSESVSDIYSFMYSASIKPWITKGYVEDITDLCNQKTLDNRTMLDSMTGNAANVLKFGDKIYGVPEYTNVTGIVYNQSLFEKNGWEIPTNTKELKALCEQILVDEPTVAPITWCADADGYLYFATENWITQCAGIANMEKFYSYQSKDIYALQDNADGSLYTAKYNAFKHLVEFFLPESPYVYDDSRTIEYIDAQYKVIKGECAMMLNGAWFENEMSTYMHSDEYKDTKIGMFAVPEMCDAIGNPVRMEGYSTENDKRVLNADYGSYYFIPTKAANKADAKDFLLYLSSEEACEIYTQYANVVRPFKYSYGEGTDVYNNVGNFGKTVLKMCDEHYLYAAASSHPLDWLGRGGLYCMGNRPEKQVLGKGADRNPDYYLQKDYDYAVTNWDAWMRQIGG